MTEAQTMLIGGNLPAPPIVVDVTRGGSSLLDDARRRRAPRQSL